MHEKRAQKSLLQSKLRALAEKPDTSAQAGGQKPPAPPPKKAIKRTGGHVGFLAGLVRRLAGRPAWPLPWALDAHYRGLQKKQASKAKQLSEKKQVVKGCDTDSTAVRQW